MDTKSWIAKRKVELLFLFVLCSSVFWVFCFCVFWVSIQGWLVRHDGHCSTLPPYSPQSVSPPFMYSFSTHCLDILQMLSDINQAKYISPLIVFRKEFVKSTHLLSWLQCFLQASTFQKNPKTVNYFWVAYILTSVIYLRQAPPSALSMFARLAKM